MQELTNGIAQRQSESELHASGISEIEAQVSGLAAGLTNDLHQLVEI